MSVWSQGAFPHYTGILRILPAPQLITINQSEGSNTWTGALSSPVAAGLSQRWGKGALPGTPVTPSTTLVSVVRPSLRDKSVPGVKKKERRWGPGVGGCSCFSSHLSVSPLPRMALFLWQGRRLTGNGSAEQ